MATNEVQYNMRMDPGFMDRLKVEAEKRGMSVAAFIKQTMEREMSEAPAPAKKMVKAF